LETHPRLFLAVIVVLWLLVYQTSWSSLLNNSFLQTFVGFVLFVLPGIRLGVIFFRQIERLENLILIGFVFSLLLTLVISLCAFAFGLSATLFQWVFTNIGLLSLVYIVVKWRV